MDTFRVRNWRKYQRYTDRRPKWFCIYTTLREDIDFTAAKLGLDPPSDAEIGQIVCIFALAAKHDDPDHDTDGPDLPMDATWIKKHANLSTVPDLNRLATLCVIECNKLSQAVTEPYAPVSDFCASENSTGQNSTADNTAASARIIDHLNTKTGKKFATSGPRAAASTDLIKARLKQGFTESECIAVIDAKVREWTGTDWAKFLRPATLFNKSKFEGYVGDIGASQPALPPLFVEEHVDAQQR